MPLKHSDIWQAIDRLAELNGMSPSGLAIKAGLSPTAFNPSKRSSKDRKHWPSTESIAQILQATGSTFDEFVELTMGEGTPRKLPLIGIAQAGRAGMFDENGRPSGRGWDEIRMPRIGDQAGYVLEVTGKSLEPVYREGDRLFVAPTEKPRRGDRIVARARDGEILVKELGRESSQKIELLSLKPSQPVLNLTPSSVEWMHRIVWASQ